jgi:hypothetical protein
MRTLQSYIEWVEALKARIEGLKRELAALQERIDHDDKESD